MPRMPAMRRAIAALSASTLTAIPATAQNCPGDFDASGVRDIDDILLYLDAFATSNPAADIAPPTGLDIDDLLLFLDLFAGGCPTPTINSFLPLVPVAGDTVEIHGTDLPLDPLEIQPMFVSASGEISLVQVDEILDLDLDGRGDVIIGEHEGFYGSAIGEPIALHADLFPQPNVFELAPGDPGISLMPDGPPAEAERGPGTEEDAGGQSGDAVLPPPTPATPPKPWKPRKRWVGGQTSTDPGYWRVPLPEGLGGNQDCICYVVQIRMRIEYQLEGQRRKYLSLILPKRVKREIKPGTQKLPAGPMTAAKAATLAGHVNAALAAQRDALPEGSPARARLSEFISKFEAEAATNTDGSHEIQLRPKLSDEANDLYNLSQFSYFTIHLLPVNRCD